MEFFQKIFDFTTFLASTFLNFFWPAVKSAKVEFETIFKKPHYSKLHFSRTPVLTSICCAKLSQVQQNLGPTSWVPAEERVYLGSRLFPKLLSLFQLDFKNTYFITSWCAWKLCALAIRLGDKFLFVLFFKFFDIMYLFFISYQQLFVYIFIFQELDKQQEH